jgi:hypothetical protein
VCFDCHGIHDIKSTREPESRVVRENLLKTCQRCHPDANINFPASWTSHYEPSRTKYPLVYFIDLFYRLVIPGTIGFILVFLGVDALRRIRDRVKAREH